jgi:thermostable 8-oxoguanine DNA glycosylase
MKSFIEAHRYPFVSEFDQESANRIFGSQKSALILMTDDKDSNEFQTFKEFAKNNIKEDLIYCISTITSGFG